ncbi:MAG: hypothetical protein ABIO44_07385 [Saprospiraceae bacterium]
MTRPVKAGVVDEAEYYLDRCASDYAGMKGSLKVELIERPGSLEG